MNEEAMIFPKTLDEFIKEYSFIDEKEIYTNGSELIQVFRIKQWEEHKENKWNELKKWLEDENNQKYSQFIYNYSINNWVLNKMQEFGGNNDSKRDV